jgi:hypothetical protein
MEFLWRRLHMEDAANRDMTSTHASLQQYSTQRRAPQAAICVAMSLAVLPLDQWVLARWDGKETDGTVLARAFAYFYWAEELLLTHRRVEPWSDSVADDTLFSLLSWQGLAAECGQAWFSEWVAPHLHNLFASGGVRENTRWFAVDMPALRFTQELQQIIITKRWPDTVDIPGLGDYAPLLTTVTRPSEFAAALVDYCDYRTAECFGYHGIDSTKRRRPSVDESVFDRGGWEQVFPVELLTLKFAFQRSTGAQLSLEAAHPLLESPLMRQPFPELMPLHEDDLTRELRSLGESVFGSQWQPRAPIATRFI